MMQRARRRLPSTIVACVLSWTGVAAAADLTAKITTSHGVIETKLYPELAPATVANFVELAKTGFYDGLIFHRVMPGFAVQTGDPTGRGGGGPGYCFADEFGEGLSHDKPGVLSMVNTAPGSNGSQFLITVTPAPVLDRRNPIFGEVTAGLDVVQKIAGVPVEGTRPTVGVKVEKIEIAGAATLTPPVKIPELTLAQLEVKAKPEIARLLGGLGESLRLGKLESFELGSYRSRCSDNQLTVTAAFEKKKEARLLVLGKSDGKTYKIEQMQWGR